MLPILLFDWDGVIYNSNRFKWGLAWKLTFQDDKNKQDAVKEVLSTEVGRGSNRYEIIRRTLILCGRDVLNKVSLSSVKSDSEVIKYAENFSKTLQESCETIRLFPHAKEVLERLKRQGYVMYVISGTEQHDLTEMADRLDVAQNFEKLFGYNTSHGGSLGKYDNFEKIVALRSESKQVYIVIGDGLSDIELAKKIDCKFIGIINKWNGWVNPERGGDVYIKGIIELEEVLKNN